MHVIFDVFGVLMSSGFESSAERLTQLLRRDRADIRETYERWGVPFDLGGITEEEFWSRVQSDLQTDVDWRVLNDAVLASYRPHTGMLELVERCATKAPTYLLSNTRREWFEVLDNQYGITGSVARAFLSFEMGLKKPDPRCYRAVVDAIGCSAGDILFFDDRAENVRAARDVGLNAVQHVSTAATTKALEDHLASRSSPR